MATEDLLKEAEAWLERESAYVRSLEYTPPEPLTASLIQRLVAALRERNETVTRLNRRVTILEGGVRENIEACERKGVSLGRHLSAAGYVLWRERAEQAEAANADYLQRAVADAIAVQQAEAALATVTQERDKLLNSFADWHNAFNQAKQERDVWRLGYELVSGVAACDIDALTKGGEAHALGMDARRSNRTEPQLADTSTAPSVAGGAEPTPAMRRLDMLRTHRRVLEELRAPADVLKIADDAIADAAAKAETKAEDA